MNVVVHVNKKGQPTFMIDPAHSKSIDENVIGRWVYLRLGFQNTPTRRRLADPILNQEAVTDTEIVGQIFSTKSPFKTEVKFTTEKPRRFPTDMNDQT
jgi:hypothetical protein